MRRAMLTALGTAGAALTLFSCLQNVFELADWLREATMRWQLWTRALWTSLEAAARLRAPAWTGPALALGASLRLARLGTRRPRADTAEPRFYALFHPIGIFGQCAAMALIAGILHLGETNWNPAAWIPPLLLLQFAAVSLIFGFVGAISPQRFIKRVWLMLLSFALLIAGNEVLKLTDQGRRVHGLWSGEGRSLSAA